ncbi:thermonuclease family protein [Nonomuraea sp. NPDC048892]|uniref:thermonuclease family protein n=1 Tax=Nonomuraea sp. NPDC048892 TaxID=3154624 RepID=UPI0033ED396F
MVIGLVVLFAIWPHMLFTSVARKLHLGAFAESGLAWGAEALWIEFLLVLMIAANGGAAFLRALYLGEPGRATGARTLRVCAVAALPVTLAATTAMAVTSQDGSPEQAFSSSAQTTVQSPTRQAIMPPQGIPDEAQSAAVVRVLRGDGVRVRFRETGKVRTVRLAGVRAPKGQECYASESTASLRAVLAPGARVWLIANSDNDKTPPAMFLWDDHTGSLVNEHAITYGSARVARTELAGERLRDFVEQEEHAKAIKIGIWSATACPR